MITWKSKKFQKIWTKQKGLCAICGGEMMGGVAHNNRHPSMRSREHIIPRSEGGSDDLDNLCLTHSKCNSIRKSKDFHEFKATYGWALYWWFAMGWARNKKPIKLNDKGCNKTK